MPFPTRFDYSAFGSNPWKKPTRRISDLVTRMLAALSAPSPAAGGSASLGETSPAATSAGPDDPAVRRYMAHLLGGQRNLMDEFVRRIAGAGIKRGGLNVRGGPALDSALHQSAMNTLAGGYADRLRQAMSLADAARTQAYGRWRNSLTDLQNLLATQHRYLSSQAGWTDRLGSMKHSDWRSELDWQRDTPFRKNRLAMSDLNLERAKRNAFWEKIDRNTRTARLNNAMAKIKQLTSKARGFSPWSFGDIYDWERGMVDLGYWKPLKRSISQKISVGGSLGSRGGRRGGRR